MSIGVTKSSHRSRSSPIPDDPCYDAHSQTSARNIAYQIKGPISRDPGISSSRSDRSGMSIYSLCPFK